MHDEQTQQAIENLGIGGLPAEQQEALLAQFGEVAVKAATFSILEKLTQEKRGEFARLTEAGDPAALQAFLDREVPDHESLTQKAVAEEIRRFKEFQAS